MKIKLFIIMTLLLVSTFSININAKTPDGTFICTDITEDGISYQVYGSIISKTSDSVTVSRTIVYDGNVTLSRTLAWTEYIDGVKYSGTLYLASRHYDYGTNQTTGFYQGTLTRQS